MTDRKTVLISGGNRGIGAATGRAFMEAGWKVSLGMRTPLLPEWADPALVHVQAYDALARNRLSTGRLPFWHGSGASMLLLPTPASWCARPWWKRLTRSSPH